MFIRMPRSPPLNGLSDDTLAARTDGNPAAVSRTDSHMRPIRACSSSAALSLSAGRPRESRLHQHGEDTFALESGVQGRQILECSQEQRTAAQQYHRQHDLQHYQRVARAASRRGWASPHPLAPRAMRAPR